MPSARVFDVIASFPKHFYTRTGSCSMCFTQRSPTTETKMPLGSGDPERHFGDLYFVLIETIYSTTARAKTSEVEGSSSEGRRA